MVHLFDGDRDFFDIATWVLQRDTIALCFVYTLPRLHSSNIHRSNKRKWFHIKKAKKQTISCRLHRWPSSSCKYTSPSRILLHSLDQAAGGIHLYVNTNKIEFMWFLSLRVFGLLSSSLLLFLQCFGMIYLLAFFRCLSNSGIFSELQTTSFIETTGIACPDSS